MPNVHVALLRGINVGGRNILPMADLRAAFEDAGFGEVRTYIQSGNVLFTSDRPATALEAEVEAMLERRVGTAITVVLLDEAGLRRAVEDAPPGFGTEPEAYKYDVLFVKAPLDAARVMEVLELRDGVDAAWPGEGVVWFRRDVAHLTKSRLSRITATAEYQQMTIRNWRTTTKLLETLWA